MGVPTPATSPWLLYRDADNDGRVISITAEFNESTRDLTRITLSRDAGCRWARILIGVGGDGSPDSTNKAIQVAEGTTVLSSQEMRRLANAGLNTIEDVQALQITAAP